MNNVFYFSHINVIGGIEQFFAYLAEKYKNWDITLFYRTGDKRQIARIRKYIRVIKFTGQHIVCDKIFYCFNTDIRPFVDAKESSLILHGDYKAMIESGQLNKDCYLFKSDFDKYYGVSQIVCDSWKQLTGLDCELVYNPFIQSPKKKLLKLVYCGRLTSEKGGDLVEKLIKALNDKNVDYILYVYSNKNLFEDKHVVYLDTRLDAGQFLNKDNFDYLIVSSKNEGYCYSLVQALSNGLPVIATPCPVFKEIGVNKSNSITIEFDGSNLDDVVKQLKVKDFKFNYTPKVDIWDKLLHPGKSNYSAIFVNIKALQDYYDVEEDLHIKRDQVYEVHKERADEIIKSGYAIIYED